MFIIRNTGKSTFVFKDKRGNFAYLEPNETTEVEDSLAQRFTRTPAYSFIEAKEIEKKVEEVEVQIKKKKVTKKK